MDLDYLLPLFGRLTAAMVLGGLIGYQRERRRHPAGLRTHMLVALGAALITLVSESYSAPGQDPSRISAQIVSGIGFLGAGTIIRHGSNIRGLTTAASLWTVAGIGIAAARGEEILILAFFATLLALITLTVVDVFEDRILVDVLRRTMSIVSVSSAVPLVLEALADAHVTIYHISRMPEDVTGAQQTYLHIKLPRRGSSDVILQNVVHVEGVRAARWEDTGQQEVEPDADEDE